MKRLDQYYIAGAWQKTASTDRHVLIDPATEKPLGEVTLATREDVDRAVAAARAAWPGFSQTDRAERLALLGAIMAEYHKRLDDLAHAVSIEMGCPLSIAKRAQAATGLGQLNAAIEALKDFQFEEQAGKSTVVHEAIGVVALITPWNWPLNQIVAKVAPALAAGNCIVLKPSEITPSCAVIFTEILHAAGVPAGVFNLIQGNGGAGQALAEHPDVDMVSFTGSTRAGVAVAQSAAPTVKRVHQELGGKSPFICLPGCDLDTALPQLAGALLLNSGQSCVAPTRLLVHRDQYAEAMTKLAAIFSTKAIGAPDVEGDHIGPVANATQFAKIQELIRSGVEDGATLVTGGDGRPDGFAAGYYVRPTIFGDVTPDMRIVREEIFGPVLCASSYASEDEAISLANDTVYGLGAYLAGDPAAARLVASKLRAGSVFLNAVGMDFSAPFGGYKQSGNGREFGRFGISEFLETKSLIGLAA